MWLAAKAADGRLILAGDWNAALQTGDRDTQLSHSDRDHAQWVATNGLAPAPTKTTVRPRTFRPPTDGSSSRIDDVLTLPRLGGPTTPAPTEGILPIGDASDHLPLPTYLPMRGLGLTLSTKDPSPPPDTDPTYITPISKAHLEQLRSGLTTECAQHIDEIHRSAAPLTTVTPDDAGLEAVINATDKLQTDPTRTEPARGTNMPGHPTTHPGQSLFQQKATEAI